MKKKKLTVTKNITIPKILLFLSLQTYALYIIISFRNITN